MNCYRYVSAAFHVALVNCLMKGEKVLHEQLNFAMRFLTDVYRRCLNFSMGPSILIDVCLALHSQSK
jgi:hypothetical protein